MMKKLFEDHDEPLLNRHDRFYHINPLKPSYIRQVMEDHNLFDAVTMLKWWSLSGGINRLDKVLLIAEVKRQQKKYNESKLVEKSHRLLKKLKLSGYKIMYWGFYSTVYAFMSNSLTGVTRHQEMGASR